MGFNTLKVRAPCQVTAGVSVGTMQRKERKEKYPNGRCKNAWRKGAHTLMSGRKQECVCVLKRLSYVSFPTPHTNMKILQWTKRH